MTFHPKFSKSYLVRTFSIIVCLTAIVTASVLWPSTLSNEWRIAILMIGFIIMSAFAYVTLMIRYQLTADTLIAIRGPFKRRIAYENILFIHEATTTKALTLYAINRQNRRALLVAQAYATQQGMSLNRYLVRFIAEPNNRNHYIKEGFDPAVLETLTISPANQPLFLTELLQYLDKKRI